MKISMATRVDETIKRKFAENAASEGVNTSELLKRLVYSYLETKSVDVSSVFESTGVNERSDSIKQRIALLERTVLQKCSKCGTLFSKEFIDCPKCKQFFTGVNI